MEKPPLTVLNHLQKLFFGVQLHIIDPAISVASSRVDGVRPSKAADFLTPAGAIVEKAAAMLQHLNAVGFFVGPGRATG